MLCTRVHPVQPLAVHIRIHNCGSNNCSTNKAAHMVHSKAGYMLLCKFLPKPLFVYRCIYHRYSLILSNANSVSARHNCTCYYDIRFNTFLTTTHYL